MDEEQQYQRYLDLSYRFLSIRNRSTKEIRDYLHKKNASDAIATRIVEQLGEEHFLDDEKFAQGWILSRARLKPKGKKVLIMELRQKGIAEDIITKVLSTEHEEIPDELTQAKNIIKSRMERFAGYPRQAVYQKVGAFLMRRGYSWTVAKKAMDSYLVE